MTVYHQSGEAVD